MNCIATSSKFTRVIVVLFLCLIGFPKFVLFTLPGISSPFRSDLLLSIILGAFILPLLPKHRLKNLSFGYILLLLYVIYYIATSESIFIAFAQLSLYASFFVVYKLGLITASPGNTMIVRYVFLLIIFNEIIHCLYRTLNLNTFKQTFVGGFGIEENFDLFGLYGTTGMPFQFVIYVAVGAYLLFGSRHVLSSSSARFFSIVLLFASLLTSDSRIALLAFLATSMGFYSLLAILPIGLLLPVLEIGHKMTDLSNFSVDYVMTDPSLNVRLENISNYFDWITPINFLFGGGAQSFLEFSTQYGVPGPIDSLPFRLLSEFGAIFCLYILYLIFLSARNFRPSFYCNAKSTYVRFLGFLVIYSFLNEGLITSRSGHLIYFTLGVFFAKRQKMCAT